MNKTVRNILIVAFAVGVLYWAFWFFVLRRRGNDIPSEPGETPQEPSTSTTPSGPSTGTVPATAKSVKVPYNEVSEAFPPTHSSIAISITNSPPTDIPPAKIHYVLPSGFSTGCKAYVWHNGYYYKNYQSEVDDQGNRTCYYIFDKTILPLQVKTSNPIPVTSACSYDVYLSGQKYRWNKDEITTGGMKYCIYNKL